MDTAPRPFPMPETTLDHIRIILVEPAGPLNVGAIARIMKNMGLRQLVLVNPRCDPLEAEARQMAVHAADVLGAARQVRTLPEALVGCRRAIATTGRDRTTLDITLEHPRVVLPWLLENSDFQSGSALIFGREDRGLTNAELNLAQRFVRIPASDLYPSLNLAQAVAICCYELHTAISILPSPLPIAKFEIQTSNFEPSRSTPAPLNALEGYYQDLEALLLKIGYLYPHTAASRMEKFRRLFNRAYPSELEVAMLRGILSQVEWALQAKYSDTK
jgi:tRNA/rRNA methyltransferase